MIVRQSGESTVRLVADTLSNLGIVIMPCDTIYGIVGVAPDTEERIRAAKGRSETNPFLRLIGTPEDLKLYSDTTPSEEILSFWPGPLTLVVSGFDGNTIALRVPDDPFLKEILREVGRSVFSTSVNVSGSPSLNDIVEISEAFQEKVDLIVDGGTLSGGTASTILDVTSTPYTVIRQGALRVPEHLL